ncbi:ferrous iron transport protein B [bacterium]|nr:ferrous iron transport protein B [bacterium]
MGKSTVFNALTGGDAHVANYPGVTVEVKHGHFRAGPVKWVVQDTPGIYSLSAQTEDEVAAEAILLAQYPNVCIQVVDTQNLSRDLYLTIELMELGYKPTLILNKWDIAEKSGRAPDVKKLEETLGLKCIPVVASRRVSLQPLKDYLAGVNPDASARVAKAQVKIDYGRILSEILISAERELAAAGGVQPVPARFAALRLLTCGRGQYPGRGGGRGRIGAGRGRGRGRGRGLIGPYPACGAEPGTGWRHHLRVRAYTECMSQLGEEPVVIVAERRHAFIRAVLQRIGFATGSRPHDDTVMEDVVAGALASGVAAAKIEPSITSHVMSPPVTTLSDRLDRWVLHPVFGWIVFVFGMWLVFQATFTLGAPVMDLIDAGVSWLADTSLAALAGVPLLASLIGEGIIPGVGMVLVFLPNIFILFLVLALLEDSGYLARGSLLTDGVLRRCGVSGRSFIPMVVSFGCNVPAILATRTMPGFKDRLITIAILPLMSCSARMPVYVLLIGAFFAHAWAGTIITLMYFLGIVVAVLLALLLRRTVATGEPGSLIIELPEYKLPRLLAAVKSMWMMGKHYIQKAGTIILAASIVIWFLFSFPQAPATVVANGSAANVAVAAEDLSAGEELAVGDISGAVGSTYAGRLGKAIAPFFAPLGFDWRVTVGLIGSTLAKEIMVSTMGVVYGVGDEVEAEDETLIKTVRTSSGLTPLTALALMIFVLLYMPCLATIAVMYRELGSARWTLAIMGLHFGTAYLLAFLAIQVGRVMGY